MAPSSRSLQLAEAVYDITWSDLPERVQRLALRAYKDIVGVTVGGSAVRSSRIAAMVGVRPPSGAAAQRRPFIPAAMPAFAYGIAASSLDYDDGHNLAGIHPGAVVVSALLAAVESGIQLELEAFLTAQVLGYELALRAGRILFVRGTEETHCSGTAGAIGAAAAVGKVLGLGKSQLVAAMEIAWAHAPVASLQLSQVKESVGWGAHTGFVSACLAEAGFGGQRGLPGFPSATPFDWDRAENLWSSCPFGEHFEIDTLYFKPYACCRYIHSAIDALDEQMRQGGLSEDEIGALRVFVPSCAASLTEQQPRSLEEAQYSFPFALACHAVQGGVTHHELSERHLRDEQILDFASRVHVEQDKEMDQLFPSHRPARLEIEDRYGNISSAIWTSATGDPSRPMSTEMLDKKFDQLVKPLLDDSGWRRLKEDVTTFGSPDTVSGAVKRLASLRDALMMEGD